MTVPDYQSLIDGPTWAFINATNASYPDDTASLTITDQRRIYDAMCAVFRQPRPSGLTVEDQTIAGVSCRIYGVESKSSVIYLHGGGFVVGGLHSHDDVCAEIAARTGLRVISVDYRLSPDHKHPAALDDAVAVARATPGPILLVGDSAGGNLCAAVAHTLRGDARLLGQVLIYPGLGGDRAKGSYLTHAHAPMLTAADVEFYAGIRFDGPVPARDETSSPLQATDFTGLPPTFALGAECDPLCDDAHAYATAIRAAGGRAHAITEAGLVHGYLRARHSVPRAAASFDRIIAAITAFAAGNWPFGDTP